MSDALDYLVKTRPEAMKAYFKFLKESSKSLDPKTRLLITVITKIATQTEKGLRQYLPQALNAGATPNEILDAILHAFPALGLAKIVWAIDILLDMDIPEFRAEHLGAEKRWHKISTVDQIPEEKATYLKCDGRSLFIYHVDGEYKIYDSRCPHQVTDIPHLALKGFRLSCPKHHWTFDIRTGECIDIGDRPLRRFEAKVEKNKLYALW